MLDFFHCNFGSDMKASYNTRVHYFLNEKIVLKQPGDSHCIIHAVRACLLKSNVTAIPSYEGLFQMLKCEILNNLDFYMGFINARDSGNSDIVASIDRYMNNKAYEQDTMDIVIFALANCLGIEVKIVQTSNDGQQYTLYTCPITPARAEEKLKAVIDLLFSLGHYDALIDVEKHELGLLQSSYIAR